MRQAVDFSDPTSIETELAAVSAEVKETKTKEKKPAKPHIVKVSFVADKDYAAGETITFDYEVPKSEGTRGIVAGIPLTEMTDDQLKIEYRNANSVFYKTKKAGRDASKSETRLNACKAEMEKRGIQPTSRTTAEMDAAGVVSLIKEGKISVDEIQALLDAASKA